MSRNTVPPVLRRNRNWLATTTISPGQVTKFFTEANGSTISRNSTAVRAKLLAHVYSDSQKTFSEGVLKLDSIGSHTRKSVDLWH